MNTTNEAINTSEILCINYIALSDHYVLCNGSDAGRDTRIQFCTYFK